MLNIELTPLKKLIIAAETIYWSKPLLPWTNLNLSYY